MLRGWIFDVGYYGNNGIHLPGFLDINQPASGAYLNCNATTPCMSGTNTISFTHNINSVPMTVVDTSNTSLLNAIRPYIGWNGGNAFEEIYTSNYHAFQSQIQKQFKDNTLFNISYTWSHCLTTYVADRSTGRIMPVQGDLRDNCPWRMGTIGRSNLPDGSARNGCIQPVNRSNGSGLPGALAVRTSRQSGGGSQRQPAAWL